MLVLTLQQFYLSGQFVSLVELILGSYWRAFQAGRGNNNSEIRSPLGSSDGNGDGADGADDVGDDVDHLDGCLVLKTCPFLLLLTSQKINRGWV